MKLNPDCIRDILLTVEENTDFNKIMKYPGSKHYPRLEKYSKNEVKYHIRQCELSGFLTKVKSNLDGDLYIYDLSPAGHEFLANIKSDSIWSKTKETARKIGSFSLDALAKIALNIVNSLINKNM